MSARDETLAAPLRGRDLTRSRIFQAGFLVVMLIAWQATTLLGLVSPFFLPRPDLVATTLVGIIASGEVFEELRITFIEYAVACPIAAFSGMLVGWLVSRGDYATRVLEPVIAGLFAIPFIIFYPLSVLFFGIGPESKIAHGVLFGFFPICLNTIQGFARVDPVYLRLARSMGATQFQTLRRILLPAAAPAILGGLRLGFMLTFLAIIGGETIASLGGLGHRIVWYAEGMETTKMFAYVVFVVLLAVLMNKLLSLLEARSEVGA